MKKLIEDNDVKQVIIGLTENMELLNQRIEQLRNEIKCLHQEFSMLKDDGK